MSSWDLTPLACRRSCRSELYGKAAAGRVHSRRASVCTKVRSIPPSMPALVSRSLQVETSRPRSLFLNRQHSGLFHCRFSHTASPPSTPAVPNCHAAGQRRFTQTSEYQCTFVQRARRYPVTSSSLRLDRSTSLSAWAAPCDDATNYDVRLENSVCPSGVRR